MSQSKRVVGSVAGRAGRLLGMVLLVALPWTAMSCSSDEPVTAGIAKGCVVNSDCNAGLVCIFSLCHEQCRVTADCPSGQRCIDTASSANVCQLPSEKRCSYHSDCKDPLRCGKDGECRNECVDQRDCLSGQVCAKSGVCAEPTEVSADGELVNAPSGEGGAGGEPGTGGTSGRGGSAGATAGIGGASAGSGGTAGKGDNGAAGAAGEGGASEPAGPCGRLNEACCRGECTATGTACVDDRCRRCGEEGEPCCDDQPCARSDLLCDAGSCVRCGGSGEACCDGNACTASGTRCRQGTCSALCGRKDEACCGSTCDSSLECVASKCRCGAIGQPCCGGTTCSQGACSAGVCSCGGEGEVCCPGPSCSASLTCAGSTCTCLQACVGEIGSVQSSRLAVLRSDGSFWKDGIALVDDQSAMVTGLTKVGAGDGWYCGIKQGTILCWGTNPYGLGNGATSSTTPVEVPVTFTAPAQPQATDIDVGLGTACAVSAGLAYCWGRADYGQNGAGSTRYDVVSLPVYTVGGGAYLTNVSRVFVGTTHACALTWDRKLHCWGNNADGAAALGQIGGVEWYAREVAPLGGNVLDASLGDSVTAAVTTDGKVWVWGYNGYGQLGDGTNVGSNPVPTPVLDQPGGAPFTDALRVVVTKNAVYLQKIDGSVLSWGSGVGHLTPAPAVDVDGNALTGIWSIDVDNFGPCYIKKDGSYWAGSPPAPALAPTCP